MKPSFRVFARRVGHAIALVLVLFAAALSLLRFWVLPQAADRLPELESQIGRLIDEKVHIGRVSAAMRGFHPELIFEDVGILDEQGRTGVRFERVGVGISLVQSVLHRQLAPVWVKIHGTRLEVRRQRDGALAVLGLTIVDHPPAWLLAAERVELLDSHIDWKDERTDSPLVDLGRADLRLRNMADRHQLSASFRWPGAEQGGLEVRADLSGELFQQGAWGGRIYLEGEGFSAAKLTGLMPAASWLRSGLTGFRVWSGWSGGQLRRAAGWVESEAPILVLPGAPPETTPLKLTGIESWFRWRESGSESLLKLSGLRTASAGSLGPAANIVLGLERDESGQVVSWRSRASGLHLGDLSTLVPGLPQLPNAARALIQDLAPAGELRELSLVYRASAAEGYRFLFCGDLADVRIRASRSVPGLSQISGRVCGREGAGSLELRVDGSDVEVPAHFHRPLRVNQAKLSGTWTSSDGGVRFESSDLAVDTPDFSARGRLALEWSDDSGMSPRIDTQLTLSSFPLIAILHYLPDSLFPELGRYLESALHGGRIAHGEVLIRGPVADFPFDRDQGVFEAVLDLEKVELLYDPRWLPLHGIDGRLRLSAHRLRFESGSGSGQIGKGRIVSLWGEIPEWRSAAWLNVGGEVRATVEDTLDFMSHSPLRRIPAGLLQFAAPKGEAAIHMNLSLPFRSEPGGIRVEGTAVLKNGSLALRDADASFGSLEGELHFSESGLNPSELSGVFEDRPARLRASTKGGEIELGVAGRTSTASLGRFFPSDLWRWVRGEGAFDVDVSIPDFGDGPMQAATWAVHSDLQGVQLDFPEPLRKLANTVDSMELRGRIEAGNRIPMSLSYDKRLSAALTWLKENSGWKLQQGTIAWNRDLPADRRPEGWRFFGRFQVLDLQAWKDFAAGLGPGAGGSDWGDKLQEVEFESSGIRWSGRDLGPLKLQCKQDSKGWSGTLESRLGGGSFQLTPGRNGYPALHLALGSLQIPHWGEGPSGEDMIDPRVLPSLHLRSRKVLWNGANLGALRMDAERSSLGLTAGTGEVAGPQGRLNFSGDWLASAGKSRTRLNGKAVVENLGNLSAELGYPRKVQDTRSTVDFRLSWSGSPLGVSMAALEGEIGIRMEEGSLLEFEPGWGRVIGFLNLNSIWRRITLDFRDLVNKGLAYDGIQGNFKLGRGQAKTEGFLIDGVATRIVIDGTADLKAETLDQIVTVIPRTSVALPIAGTLAGGPAVGAAIFVAQELVGEQVDSITATRYKVTGRWDHPAIDKVEGDMPMELLDRAWSGLKNLSGGGSQEETKK